MKKYYRVIKDTFLWDEGAILESSGSYDGENYMPVDDLWNKTAKQNECISAYIIEQGSDWFERVYPDTLKGNIYRTKDQMVELYKTSFKK